MFQKTNHIYLTALFLLALYVFMIPGIQAILAGVQRNSSDVTKIDLMDIEGKLVCVSEEMAKYQKTKVNCSKYGHVIGLSVSDGTIWTFYPNPLQRELRDKTDFISRGIKIRGRLFYSGKIIEIVSYEFLPKPSTLRDS